MPSGDGRVQVRWSVAAETERWVKGEVQRRECAPGDVVDTLVEQAAVEKLEEIRMPLARVEDRFDRVESCLKQLQSLVHQRPAMSHETSTGSSQGRDWQAEVAMKILVDQNQMQRERIEALEAALREARKRPWWPWLLVPIGAASVTGHFLIASALLFRWGWHENWYWGAMGINLLVLGCAGWQAWQHR